MRRTAIPGAFTIHELGNNLVVLGAPAAQLRIAEFLDDLRIGCGFSR